MLRRLYRERRERKATPGGHYRPISDYGIIGDQHTVALVGTDGSIDWACFPRFDSNALFCRILDERRGGTFRVGPLGESSVTREYLEGTAVLVTEHDTSSGRFRVLDFLSMGGGGPGATAWEAYGGSRILRCIEGICGEADVEIRFHPTFGFGRRDGEMHPTREGVVASSRHEWAALACPASLHSDDRGGVRGIVRVRAGDRLWLRMRYGTGKAPLDVCASISRSQAELEQTVDVWRQLMSPYRYEGPYGDKVRRSALLMRLLTYGPTGALIAAPTTSLPEEEGTGRNFDYRYAWIRDSSLAARGLQIVGFEREGHRMVKWLLDTLTQQGRPDRAVALAVDGQKPPRTRKLKWLEGHGGAAPVRVGFRMIPEIDDYGELMQAVAVTPDAVEQPHWRVLRKYANSAATRWFLPDRTIWEFPGMPRHYLYSAVMCWTAVDRAIRLGRQHGKWAPYPLLEYAQRRMRRYILQNGFNPEVGAFTQVFGGTALDASALVIPLTGLLPATDPRMASTIRTIQARLAAGPLVYRYMTGDKFDGLGSPFVLCSFWLVDNLLLLGDVDSAVRIFEGVTAHANDLGLLSEEIDVDSGELRGNFPQLLSHLGLIRSAHLLGQAERLGVDGLRRRSPYAQLQRGDPSDAESMLLT